MFPSSKSARLIIKTRILTSSLVIFLSSILLIGIISSSSHAYAQQSSRQSSNQELPESIIAASSTDTTPHVLKLRATQQGEDGQPKKVSGFKIDLTNVVTTQINSQVLVFITDSSVHVIGAKIRTVSGQLIDLVPSTTTKQTNAFSVAGLPVGVYTLDIITQKGNTKAAYEGILVISQQPTTVINENTKNVINQEINQNTRDDTDIIIKNVFKPKTKKVVDKERICLFTPNHPDCKPKDGKCPKGWGMNEDEYCFPAHKKCPKGYWRADDDESGACVKKPKDVPVPIDLPLCDGSYQRCITENGDVCEPGSTGHECEAEGVLCSVPGVEGCHTYKEGICVDCEEEPVDPCIENPDAEGCQSVDPCIENPDAEGCQEPLPPTDSCEENPSLPECQQEDIEAAFADEEPIDEEPIDEGDDVDEGDESNGASSDDEAGDGSEEEGGDEEE